MNKYKSLNQLVQHSQLLERLMIESEGLITPEIEALLAVTEVDQPDKVNNYQFMLERFALEESFYKAKADAFARMAKARKMAAEKLKENLKYCMQTLGTDRIDGVDYYFKLSNSAPKLIITSENAVPREYITETIVRDVNKKAIKEAITNGLTIEGAHLEECKALRSYPMPTKKLKGAV
jgi:hypothetical protein